MKKEQAKALLGMFIFPLLIVAGVLTIVRFIFMIIFQFTWETSTTWRDDLIIKLNDYWNGNHPPNSNSKECSTTPN